MNDGELIKVFMKLKGFIVRDAMMSLESVIYQSGNLKY